MSCSIYYNMNMVAVILTLEKNPEIKKYYTYMFLILTYFFAIKEYLKQNKEIEQHVNSLEIYNE